MENQRSSYQNVYSKIKSADPDLIPPNIEDKKTAEFHLSFESFSQTIRDGNLGKTPQYWLLYLEMMRSQHMIHLVV